MDWETVSIRFFEQSEGEFFEPFWTCREKWNNYLSPSLNKGEWSVEEELSLLSCVAENGHRWALIASLLGGSRTEHMVKNRFKKMVKESSYKGASREEKPLLADLTRQKLRALKRMKGKDATCQHEVAEEQP